MAPLLVADSVGKAFAGRKVLTSATLRAERGEVRVLFGRNGSGKSTLMKIAPGVLAPDTGVVHYDGHALLRARLHALAAQGVFYLPDHDLLSRALTLGAQLEMFARRYGRGEPGEAAAAVGLGGFLEARPGRLSGGELRRAELAAALVRGPACLLADEPFRGVAPLDAAIIAAAFRRLAAQGCAVVFTGHEVETLLDAADRVVWCTDGTTYELGAPEEARRHWRFRGTYLGRAG